MTEVKVNSDSDRYLKNFFFLLLFYSAFCTKNIRVEMEQDDHELEDGEIGDDSEVVNDYTPLQRPVTYALDAPQKRFQEIDTQYSDSEDELQSSETDSDSDAGPQQSKKPKKPKRKVIPKPLKRLSDRVKKYDVWSTRAQEDVLAETMVACDVTLKDRARDVESYDYSIASKLYEELENQQGNKRTRDEMKNFNFRPRRRSPTNSDKDYKGKPRHILELTVDEASNVEDIVKDIATKLCEERDDLIFKVVETMGKEKSIELYKETKRIESEGGMPILNQTRRRTPGGVFLYLVRNDYHITPEQRQNIFNEDKQRYNRMIKEQKKKKLEQLKRETNLKRNKILPELLTRAELFAEQKPTRKLKETDEASCTNPPPSPETDHHESGDGMEPSPAMVSQSLPTAPVTLNTELENIRDKLKTYDDDFLDINCDNEMDLF